jgi:glutathione synthase/RimK-type ligase-like ATP-grasp enzyme
MTNVILRRARLGAVSTRGIAAASVEGLQPFLNSEDIPEDVFYLFRWGCTSPQRAQVVVQPASAISLASNKAESRKVFQAQGISIPPTWFHPTELDAADIRCGVITRPAHHHQGRMVFKSLTRAGLEYSFRQCQRWDPTGEAYISLFIPKEREYRIYVVQGRVAAVAEKTPPAGDVGRVAWNHARGGSFHNVKWDDWPLNACFQGVRATEALGLDFAGIDVMTRGDQCWVLEPNAAPSLSSPYRQQCMAKCFDFMIAYGRGTIPYQVNTYKGLIHPALKDVEVPTHEVEEEL